MWIRYKECYIKWFLTKQMHITVTHYWLILHWLFFVCFKLLFPTEHVHCIYVLYCTVCTLYSTLVTEGRFLHHFLTATQQKISPKARQFTKYWKIVSARKIMNINIRFCVCKLCFIQNKCFLITCVNELSQCEYVGHGI